MPEQLRRLSQLLAGGPVRIGELRLWRAEDGSFRVCHVGDFGAGVASLQAFDQVDDAREIAKFTEDGSYRVLKAGRDLRRGWILCLPDAEAVAQALEFFYPAALGQWLAAERGKIRIIPFREVLGRQSGIYRVSQGLDERGMDEVVTARCRAQCLRRRLWLEGGFLTDETALAQTEGSIPLVCSEACSLLIADAARAVAAATKNAEGDA